MNTIPDGFTESPRRSPLTTPWEPIYQRITDAGATLAIEVRECHCNGRGFAHGGLIASLSVNGMGTSLVMKARKKFANDKISAVTLSMTTDYIDSAQIGDWLEFRPEVLKVGKSIGFTGMKVVAARDGEERLIARANASFKLV
ncbi:MAG: PaaI family thioesterase [Sneathiella sp.]|nr:PaaI family thioesterase [Sneathiella sp.]